MTKLKRLGALIVHDLIAHPLIGLSGGAVWAWDLHDMVGEIATIGASGTALRISGPAADVERAIAHLEPVGWDFPGRHAHGVDGRGCTSGVYRPPKCECPCKCGGSPVWDNIAKKLSTLCRVCSVPKHVAAVNQPGFVERKAAAEAELRRALGEDE